MTSFHTTDDVIRALGGPTAVGRLVTRNPQAVNHWRVKNFGRFPSWTYLLLTEALRQKGLTAPVSLWGITEPVRRKPSSQESAQ